MPRVTPQSPPVPAMAKTKPMAAAAGEKKKSKGKKKGKNGPAKVAMKASGAAAEERSNPFEAIWSRRKFDVLGKKRKGEEQRISRSCSEAIRKRENTLLKEFVESGKSSVFHDRRIGERDDTLPEFNKAILRQQRERLAKLKRESKYNLSDDDEDETNHNMLSEKDDFDEEVPLDDGSDEEGKMVLSKKRLSLQSDNHPSVTDLPQETHGQKSKKEVMTEIISKSKFYKAERAKEREEDEHLLDKLDSDFASLAQTQALLSLTESAKVKVNKNDSSAGLTGKEIFNKAKADTYEKLVKEMVMDQRARPSDRTKTPEEIAQEEKERLEKLEEERQKRMLGTADSSDEDDDNEDGRHMKLGNSKPISGDDLGDSFSLDESVEKKKGWVDEIYEREGRKIGDNAAASDDGESDDENVGDDGADDEEDSEEDSSDNDFGNMSARDWEQSDDDEVDIGDDEMEDFKEEQEINGKVLDKDAHNLKGESNVKPQVKDGSIPFVIDAPNDLKDLSSLLDGRSEAEIIEIITRIRTCNSIRLAAENRRKMQVFYGVLLQYFAILATQSPVKFRIIDTLVKPLIEMSGETPYFAAICARERLIHTRTRLCEDIKVPGKSSWPNLKTLLLLRLWSLIFPCSDFRHVVATPLLLLMCEYLMRCPIQSGRDVAVGSFLCSMVLVVTKESKKFCPEAIGFLQSLLVTSLKGKVGTHLHNQINDQFMELKTLKPWLSIHDQVDEVNPVNILEIVGMDPDAPYFSSDNFKAGVLLSVAECLRGFVIIHEGLCSFPEIFLPISSLLQEILERSELPGSLQNIFHEIIDLVKKRSDEHHASREPLRLRKKKPEPIKQLNPKFEENYIKGLDYDPDRERAQMKKLRKRVKSEMKGAKRELQKDNYFLSAVKEKERRKRDEERAEMYGKAMAFLQEQESAFKSGQLGKGKGRKRRR